MQFCSTKMSVVHVAEREVVSGSSTTLSADLSELQQFPVAGGTFHLPEREHLSQHQARSWLPHCTQPY